MANPIDGNAFQELGSNSVKVIIRPSGKSDTPTILDFKVIFLNLDELDEDLDIRRRQIYCIVKKEYEKEKKLYESSPEYGGKVKNGTYIRKFYVLDPATGTKISILIAIQRYKDMEQKRTRTFYGGLFMRRYQYLIYQIFRILMEKAMNMWNADSPDPTGFFTNGRITVNEHCTVWMIGIKLYYRVFKWFRLRFFPSSPPKDAWEFLSKLYTLCYSYGL